MMEILHISARMCLTYAERWIHSFAYAVFNVLDVLVNKMANMLSDLSCLDFFLWRHMKNLVYISQIDSDYDLVAKIAVVTGYIELEIFGIITNVRNTLRWRCEVCNVAGRNFYEQFLRFIWTSCVYHFLCVNLYSHCTLRAYIKFFFLFCVEKLLVCYE